MVSKDFESPFSRDTFFKQQGTYKKNNWVIYKCVFTNPVKIDAGRRSG